MGSEIQPDVEDEINVVYILYIVKGSRQNYFVVYSLSDGFWFPFLPIQNFFSQKIADIVVSYYYNNKTVWK